ncbi:hypothetical protein Z046_33125 [Pseudomonas aeruginosa VRFPA09]|nr:hypothetical protein Z046_33125 [Pseudomonas aeruginosa VRFPA09]
MADIAYDLLPSVTRKLGCFCRLVPNVAIKPLQAILRFRGQLLLAKHADSSFAGNWEGLLGICRTGRILARSVKQHCPGALPRSGEQLRSIFGLQQFRGRTLRGLRFYQTSVRQLPGIQCIIRHNAGGRGDVVGQLVDPRSSVVEICCLGGGVCLADFLWQSCELCLLIQGEHG